MLPERAAEVVAECDPSSLNANAHKEQVEQKSGNQ